MNKIIITNIYKEEIFSYKQKNNTIKITVEKAISNGANLCEANLCGASLCEAKLCGANLYEANLYEANLYRANLYGADLYRADLYRADLYRSNLCEANLYGANLCGANLCEANLYRANLYEANLCEANLCGADLYRTKIDNLHRSNLNILKSQKNNLIVYKYLNKRLISPYQNFQYEIGKEYISIDANENDKELCGKGINIATLEWCLQNTNNDINNFLYIECEINPKDLIIPFNTDGKFRIKSGGKVKLNKILTKIEINGIINN